MNDRFLPWQWTARREISGRLTHGARTCDVHPKRFGSAARLHRSVYERVQCTYSTHNGYSSHLPSLYDPCSRAAKVAEPPPILLDYGGVFNFDFSPDGSTLVCACERKTLAIFDPHNRRQIKAKTDAHNDCVNGIRFIDRHTFCSCSDDRTVRIWDLRNLQQPKCILTGHEHWVKNVEYVDGCLVSSGFDSKILLWSNIATIPSGQSPAPQLLFSTKNLMRTAINSSARTLAMSFNSGFIMVVHDLDLAYLANDLRGFRPHNYHLMQMTGVPMRNAHTFSHLFDKSRTRNRVELVSDFAESNDAEIISSLKIHPQGWCMLSRNTSADRKNEYTSVHDIRCEPVGSSRSDEDGCSASASSDAAAYGPSTGFSFGPNDDHSTESLPSYTVSISIEQRQIPRSSTSSAAAAAADSGVSSGGSVLRSLGGRKRPHEQAAGGHSTAYSPPRFNPAHMPAMASADSGMATDEDRRRERVISQVLPSAHERMLAAAQRPAARRADTVLLVVTSDGDGRDRTFVIIDDEDANEAGAFANAGVRIHQNEARLAYYCEEPNMNHGFIKEPCFSRDGRIICSPFAHGFRLLAFDDACNEPFICGAAAPYSAATRRPPVELKEVASAYSHKNVVASSAMSPVEPLVVTGCLGGQVCFYQPVL